MSWNLYARVGHDPERGDWGSLPEQLDSIMDGVPNIVEVHLLAECVRCTGATSKLLGLVNKLKEGDSLIVNKASVISDDVDEYENIAETINRKGARLTVIDNFR